MIHVWLPNPKAALRVWQDTTQNWQVVEGWQEVGALAALQDNKNRNKAVCLYFPSVYLLQLEVDLTTQQLKTLGENGRRYLFEDSSIGSVDDLIVKSRLLAGSVKPTQANHDVNADLTDASEPTASQPASNAQNLLYALHDADRESWLAAASLAGLQIAALLPDFVLLPPLPDTDGVANAAIWYQDTDTQLLTYTLSNDSTPTGMAIGHLSLALTMLKPDVVYVCGTPERPLPTEHNITYQAMTEVPRPAATPLRHALNFAQATSQRGLSKYAKTILALIVLAMITTFTLDVTRLWYYQKAQKRAQAMLTTQYRDWFPNERLNPRLSVQRQLAGKLIDAHTTPSANVLNVLSNIAPILQQNQLVAEQMIYQNNQIQLTLHAPNIDNVNRAVAALSAQGVNAKLGNANSASIFADNGATNHTSNPNLQTQAVIDIKL